MANIETRTIQNVGINSQPMISGNSFIIKEYQRGYRWESQQVESLLEDLQEFDHNQHKVKYCMQPLVVKRVDPSENPHARELSQIIGSTHTEEEPDTAWELIDGQQRLTTTLLVLDSCNQALREPKKLPYRIFYSLIRDIDAYYINNAKKTIDEWFNSFGDSADDVKNEIRGKINSDIEFIWYEVDAKANSVDIFTKLNIGKIPLTNAELFKAQLLNPDNAPTETQQKLSFQINLTQIAFEWDKIEQSLRDNDFWSFISNNNQDGETRIDYLLRLYAIQLKKCGDLSANISEHDNLFPFVAINAYLKNHPDSTSSTIWESIVAIHDKLKSWYSGRENSLLYHYIGFLIAVDKSNINVITNLIKSTEGKRKSEVDAFVLECVRKEMTNVKLDELSYQKDGAKIRKALLLFNLQTLIISKTDARFSFKQYKDPKIHWDIEHIHARATDEEIRAIKIPDKRIEFLRTLSKQFEVIGDSETVQEIEIFITDNVVPDIINEDMFLEFCCRITDRYGDFDENGIGNLTLLDAETNRSYHNALYPIKRMKIIERDKGDVFVPVCTKNVFLKMYSTNFSNMMSWTKDDANDYLMEMKKVLIEEAQICQ